MPIKYIEPLPSVAELEGELGSGRPTSMQSMVRRAEIYTLQNLNKILGQFAQNTEEARRVIDANEESLRAGRSIGYPRIRAYKCTNPEGEKRYPIIRVNVTDQSCLFGKGEWMTEESKEKLADLKESGFVDQNPINPFGMYDTSSLLYIDELQIEVRELKTENPRLKTQGSRLYMLVADTIGSSWCADCSAGIFLNTLSRETKIPVVGCFSSVEGAGDRPNRKKNLDDPEEENRPYAPLIVVPREDRSASTLSETPVDQFIEEWHKYWKSKGS